VALFCCSVKTSVRVAVSRLVVQFRSLHLSRTSQRYKKLSPHLNYQGEEGSALQEMGALISDMIKRSELYKTVKVINSRMLNCYSPKSVTLLEGSLVETSRI